jgi:hypothetical protein
VPVGPPSSIRRYGMRAPRNRPCSWPKAFRPQAPRPAGLTSRPCSPRASSIRYNRFEGDAAIGRSASLRGANPEGLRGPCERVAGLVRSPAAATQLLAAPADDEEVEPDDDIASGRHGERHEESAEDPARPPCPETAYSDQDSSPTNTMAKGTTK